MARKRKKEKTDLLKKKLDEETALFNDWEKWKEACTLVKKNQHEIFRAQSESGRQLAEWESAGYETRHRTKLLLHFLTL